MIQTYISYKSSWILRVSCDFISVLPNLIPEAIPSHKRHNERRSNSKKVTELRTFEIKDDLKLS